MKNIIILFLFCVFFGVAHANDCKMDDVIASTFDLGDDDNSSKLLIRPIKDSSYDKNNPLGWVLSRLNSDCKETILGKFDADFPISVFYFSDSRKIFGTISNSGTAEIYRVFSNKTGKMILRHGSKSPPSVFWVADSAYPIFYFYDCLPCDNNFGFYIIGGRGVYRKATLKESKVIRQEIAKQLIDPRPYKSN
jgi:hypothetical protein